MAMPDPTLPAQDARALAALLGNLLPLLTQYQTLPPPALEGMWAADSALVDHQAAVALVQDITGAALRKLAAYLERHAPRHRALEGCIPVAAQAAQAFAARDYAASLALVWQAYRAVTAAQFATPELPPLQEPAAGSQQTH